LFRFYFKTKNKKDNLNTILLSRITAHKLSLTRGLGESTQFPLMNHSAMWIVYLLLNRQTEGSIRCRVKRKPKKSHSFSV